MEEQNSLQEESSCQQHHKSADQSEDTHGKRKLETTGEDTCNDESEKKSMSRRMEKKKRKQEAKKIKQEKNNKRKLEEEEEGNNSDGNSQDTSEVTSNKKKKKPETDKNKQDSHKPSVTLTLKNHFNKAKDKEDPRLKMKDIQDLVLYSILWHSIGVCPRWCQVLHRKKIKKVVVIALRSLGQNDYLQNIDSFPYIFKEFNEHVVPTKASGTDFSFKHPYDCLLNVPISKNQIRKELEQSIEELKQQDHVQIKSRYLLTNKQLKDNDYPRQCYTSNADDANNDDGFVSCVTNEANGSSDNKSPLFALDCEMCETSAGQELTRLSIIDESFNVVYDTLVMPDRPILDYKTKYSGITAERLQGVTVTLQDVQKEIQRLLPHDAILAGHSLNFDLQALKMYHNRIIDTSVMFGDKRGAHFKPALKYLAHQLLSKTIQKNPTGHCSIEDAKTVMELVKRKFEAGPSFGQNETPTEGLFHRIDREERKDGKIVSAMLDYPSIVKFHQSAGNHVVSRVSDSEIVSSAVNLINISDFVWLHLHGAQHFYDGMSRDDLNEKQEVFKTLDSRVSGVCQAIPEDSLVVIIMGCGDVTEVLRIRRDPEPRSEELRHAVAEAKKGLCFLKIT